MERIVYNAWCASCGCLVNTPHHWELHNKCIEVWTTPTGAVCPECGSTNLQPQGGCLVCLDCGWESCG